MKTLLLGGPENGNVIDAHRGQFGYGIVTETIKASTNELLGTEGYNYTELSLWHAKHPAKKKGTMKVFVFTGKKVQEPTDVQIREALSQCPPEAKVYNWLYPERTKEYIAE